MHFDLWRNTNWTQQRQSSQKMRRKLKGKYYKQLQKYISKDYIKKQGIFNYNGLEILNNKFQSLNNENITEKVWTFFIFQFLY
jgi:hypothetical protein